MNLDILVEKFKQKDEKAFESLYTMYSESMHGVIYNIVRNQDIAEEVMQDVFIKAWHKADTYSSTKGRLKPGIRPIPILVLKVDFLRGY